MTQLQVLLPMFCDACNTFILHRLIIGLVFFFYLLNDICNFWYSGKCLPVRLRKQLPTFTIKLLLKRELNWFVFFYCSILCCLFSGPDSGILTGRCSLLFPEYGKIRTRITPNTGSFYTMKVLHFSSGLPAHQDNCRCNYFQIHL